MRLQDGRQGLYAPQVADQIQVGAPAAATQVIITLPAVAGYLHAISLIVWNLNSLNTATASGLLEITSTNLQGFAARQQQGLAVNQVRGQVLPFTPPLLSQTPGAASTITFPAPLAGSGWDVLVAYSLIPTT